ncbi:MAG: D-aminoacyl-tRNA deacylase [Chloroflexota bacterium]|nr:D-tyrosyl-tRNA(Tyr) deacylase [Chloroflexota bacterium]NOG64790.1 D-tyrosyl-tRNA(Tyr) deacylase [Chloroflexota bacterium]GIK63264.1 MAG: D-aminoacyl-tRNA deacylase [Chloroflexota bacterium]
MRAVVQRVTKGSVTVEGQITGAVEQGFVILLGVKNGDTEAEARWLANKVAGLRVFDDDEGKMNRSLLDVGGGALVVSQFTLYADARRGKRPGFTDAAPPEIAEPLVNRFVELLREFGVQRVETGIFRAMMLVEIHNDGPVTILLERDAGEKGGA